QAGKGAGYARWAKVFNLKQMAQTMNYLTEHVKLGKALAPLQQIFKFHSALCAVLLVLQGCKDARQRRAAVSRACHQLAAARQQFLCQTESVGNALVRHPE
ncbi:hypothetical protein D1644_14805, partial [Neglecta sp. 59]|nr:hypothetical protein [Neglectibacter sp. 59]